MVVEDLAMLGKYGREAYSPAFGERNSFHLTDNLLLHPADAYAFAGDGVHLLSQHSGRIEFDYLFRSLY